MTEIQFDTPEKRTFDHLSSLEWLETNGSGGYSSSTVSMANTRKYHGLLVAPLQNKPEKYVLLSALEECIVINNRTIPLSCHQYKDTVSPEGFAFVTKFSPAPAPSFIYQTNELILKKEILMAQGETAVLIRYTFVKNSAQATLRIRPLIAYRNFHVLMKENGFINGECRKAPSGFSIEPYAEMPLLFTQSSHPVKLHHESVWYRNFYYKKENERGFDSFEDLFCPAEIEISISGNDEIIMRFGTDAVSGKLATRWHKAFEDKLAFENELTGLPEQRKALARSASQFITRTESGKKSVVAGYHWFLDWGRDAMIALPGLTLVHGKPSDALAVLEYFAEYERNGLIPNFIHPTGEAAYNTVDASLWFGWAVQQYYLATEDFNSLKKIIWPVIKKIISAHIAGTENKISMLENGLISAGDEQTQLTWMDAMAYGKPVTPRWGCAVEINALWYNLLCFAKELSALYALPIDIPDSLPTRVKDSFQRIFWMNDRGYLADVITNESRDLSIRPNQLFAVSLPYSMLSIVQMKSVMDCVTKHLLTPVGLRTLSPADPRYKSHYSGGADERDSAYHNGTVWPWLMGHYAEALLKCGDISKTRRFLDEWVSQFENRHLAEAGLFTISEVFDGDKPHNPDGCIAQAWSVSEILRLHSLLDTDHKIKQNFN